MRIIKDNAPSLVLFTLFSIFWTGQAIMGWNWESEFLQMAGFVLLSAFFWHSGLG